ncbi:MAG: hypothetical protein M1269_05595 [Chloroflexi bacterium]|nr:hypothetical protein [Chloroflexota bacterium]
MNNEEQNIFLKKLGGIFLWCFLLTYALLIFSFVFYLTGAGWAYGIHSKLFGLSRHDFDVIYYSILAFTKICAIMFFLIPWISIKIVLRKK